MKTLTENHPLKRTPLNSWHKNKGAKCVEFAGWEMPVVYTSIIEEHLAVRENAGIFDISHMGQIFVEGTGALKLLQKLCTNDISKIGPGHAIYSHICNEQGGVIDDIFVYSLTLNHYLVVVNASTAKKDFDWMTKQKIGDVALRDESDFLGMIALQGPKAIDIASKCFKNIPARHECLTENIENKTMFFCRTGYTGEDGLEIILPEENSLDLWEKILFAGKNFNLLPCGLGSRDTLRLEAGYLLYGNDMDEEHTSIESGPSWVVKLNKENFIGKEALLKQKNGTLKKHLLAFKLMTRGIPRHGSKIFCQEQAVGQVTSGTFSPMLKIGIALGYVPLNLEGNFSIECNGKKVPAELTKLPFYNK